jgi:ATP-dependent exoDNAse (exonuclease V) beta subunit
MAGRHRVVWWDPGVLQRETQGRAASRLTDFLKEDELKIKSQEGIRVHEAWQRERADLRVAAAETDRKVITATGYALGLNGSEPISGDPEVVVESLDIDFARPHGKRFGTLVHAVMAVVSLAAGHDVVAEAARLQGRILGGSEEEITAATKTVLGVLRHPLIRQAALAEAKGLCRRETSVALKLADGLVVEGVVDLAFQDAQGAWTVIDYKTDFEVSGRLEEYKKQVGLYAQAIRHATGNPAGAVLLRL